MADANGNNKNDADAPSQVSMSASADLNTNVSQNRVKPMASNESNQSEKTAADESQSSAQHQLGTVNDAKTFSHEHQTNESARHNKHTKDSDMNRVSAHHQVCTNDDSNTPDEDDRMEVDHQKFTATSSKKKAHKISSNISYSENEPDLLEVLWERVKNKNLLDRLLGCAYGQALGDSYGLSTEFETREDVARNYPDSSKLIPYPDYILTGHSRRWTRGDWTDDTDQWILIFETLTETNNDEPDEIVFARKLSQWIRQGYPVLGDHGGMGLGANVAQVVYSFDYLTNPLKASEAVWERGNRQAAPNGAVMRCSASAFVHYKDKEKVISTTELMCKTTHFDPRCIASCLAVCLTITYLLNEDFDPNDIESLIKRVQDETIHILGDRLSTEHRDLFLWHTNKRTLEDLNLDEPRTIGYTYKCLGSGFYGLRSTRPFEETLNDLIRYGGDADTNGAVCGTMYGARHGYRKLPRKWLQAMPFKKWFDQKLVEYCTQTYFVKQITV